MVCIQQRQIHLHIHIVFAWCSMNLLLLLLCWSFTALWHFSCHFGRGELTYPHCSWASLLGSLPVLSAHSFTRNWQLPFLNQRKRENARRNYFMTNLHERMLPDVRIEPATVRIPGGMRIRSSYHAKASSYCQRRLWSDYMKAQDNLSMLYVHNTL